MSAVSGATTTSAAAMATSSVVDDDLTWERGIDKAYAEELVESRLWGMNQCDIFARRAIEKIATLQQDPKRTERAGYLYKKIGLVYYSAGDEKRGLNLWREAKRFFQLGVDNCQTHDGETLERLARIHLAMNEPTSAVECVDKIYRNERLSAQNLNFMVAVYIRAVAQTINEPELKRADEEEGPDGLVALPPFPKAKIDEGRKLLAKTYDLIGSKLSELTEQTQKELKSVGNRVAQREVLFSNNPTSAPTETSKTVS
jgi:tetratricopeptide (TPR) repeat protein